jgi:hypothetical protein
MAKYARGKHRNADKRRIGLRSITDKFSERHFGNVPFAVFDKAEENFLHRQHKTGQHDALGGDHAVHQVAHMVVIGGGERQMQPRRAAGHDYFRLTVGAAYSARFVDGHGRRPPNLRRHPTLVRRI